jgi:SAM-dependent MidA family methyltransferase
MERCLYGANGFYSTGRGSAGRRRDFITSPEVGPLFGAVLANAINQLWVDLGRPQRFPVLDLGTGPGTLIASLKLASPPCSQAWDLRGLDRANRTDSDWPDPTGGVILANELLDNLSFRIVENTGGALQEVWVVDGREQLRPTDLVLDIPPGTRAPVQSAAHDWVSWALQSGAAHVLGFDYGALSTSELARRGGWLRTYVGHNRGNDPLVSPGSVDITADVAIDQLPKPTQVVTQAEFLTTWGIKSLVAEGKEYWQLHAAAPDVAALRMRSRVSEAAALLDPDGLGHWFVIRWDTKHL